MGVVCLNFLKTIISPSKCLGGALYHSHYYFHRAFPYFKRLLLTFSISSILSIFNKKITNIRLLFQFRFADRLLQFYLCLLIYDILNFFIVILFYNIYRLAKLIDLVVKPSIHLVISNFGETFILKHKTLFACLGGAPSSLKIKFLVSSVWKCKDCQGIQISSVVLSAKTNSTATRKHTTHFLF